MASSQMLELLRNFPLLQGIGDDVVQAIAQAGEFQVARRNDIVVREDDAGRGLYLLLEGDAKVVLSAHDGREAMLAFLTEGDFFGEMSLLDGDPRSATVRAITDVRLLLLRRDAFLSLLTRYPDITVAMLIALSGRLRNANRKISALALSPVHARVAGALLQIAEMSGVRVRGQIVIRDKPTQQDIADMANTTRETVSRVLGQMQKDGLVTVDGREMILLDEERLKGEP